MSYNFKDHYSKLAKKQGYKARSVFKLDEINDRYRVFDFQKPLAVFDAGCSPGSWSQWVLQHFKNPKSYVIGVDLLPTDLKHPQGHFYQKDFRELDRGLFKGVDPEFKGFDVILSDMAPKTSGIRSVDQARSAQLVEEVIEFARGYLKPGGHLVCKLFHSEDFATLKKQMTQIFSDFQAYRPKATRTESKEIFLIGLRRK